MKINNALAQSVIETLRPVSKNGRAIGLGTNKTDVSVQSLEAQCTIKVGFGIQVKMS